ncbi:MAG: AbrB/MazE/SpoVT family DNA-binding domain-containing protein [Candidatus Pacebacteria bacterium]|nr:AbrB/MazE/SpoVT family DNA-binding domain-containing protein [Candidatus Paceibacterota bacterium]PIR60652.1 MAG: AbrB family transcriptional regulator [Candidatus Pacebacteria bacterium CG10_big_fil_rev_8_21_14_0_10_45_6]
MYTATVTAQGQITIPIALRRALKLDRAKVIITQTNAGTIEIEPEPDIMSLLGSVKATTSKSISEIVEEEVLKEYKRTEKRLSNTPIIV